MLKKEKISKKKKKVNNKEKENIKINKLNNNKIILETSADLYKLPLSSIKNTKLYDYSGNYFEQMYKDLLKAEKNGEEIQISSIFNTTNNKKEIKINRILFRVINPFYKSDQELYIIGSIKELGNWNQEKALKMEFDKDDNVWEKELNLMKKKDFEYKFIFVSNGIIIKWEDGNNRIFKYSYIKKLVENNLEDGIAHIEEDEENQESFDNDLKEKLLIINCDCEIN